MAYTTVALVTGLFPNFTRNGPKGPSDTVIQGFINDEASQINAILQRRFSEAICAFPGSTLAQQFIAYIANLGADPMNVLEHANTYAAAGELAEIFEATGITGGLAKIAAVFEGKAQEIYQELDGRDEKGQVKKDGGRFDKLFDSLARSVSPRSEFFGIAGGDQPRVKDPDVTDYFKKWPGTRAD